MKNYNNLIRSLYSNFNLPLDELSYDRLIIPNQKEIFALLDRHRNHRILIIDDKDADGTLGAYCCASYLKALGFSVDIYMNFQHGVDEFVLDKSKSNEHLLVIIIDSSTNLAELYKGRSHDVLIIDHHSLDDSPDIRITTPAQNQNMNNFVLNINCKFEGYEQLKNVSAGFLTYLIFDRYYKSRTDFQVKKGLDLSRFGIITLYSDIVPTDEEIQKILIYNYRTSKRYNTKNTMSYDIIPKINGTRRLHDKITCYGFYNNSIMLTTLLDGTYSQSKKVLGIIMKLKKVHEFQNFTLIDLTMPNQVLNYPVTNFKGLICNMVSSINGRICLAYVLNEENKYDVSIRSSGVNSLEIINNLKSKYTILGGGHLSASGFTIPEDEFEKFLSDLDVLLSNVKAIPKYFIPINRLEDTNKYNLQDIALINELTTDNEIYFVYNLNKSEFKRLNRSTVLINDNSYSYTRTDIDNALESNLSCFIKAVPYLDTKDTNSIKFKIDLVNKPSQATSLEQDIISSLKYN